jgi:hypothetical protein
MSCPTRPMNVNVNISHRHLPIDEAIVYAAVVCTERYQLICVIWLLGNFHKSRNAHQPNSLVIKHKTIRAFNASASFEPFLRYFFASTGRIKPSSKAPDALVMDRDIRGETPSPDLDETQKHLYECLYTAHSLRSMTRLS